MAIPCDFFLLILSWNELSRRKRMLIVKEI